MRDRASKRCRTILGVRRGEGAGASEWRNKERVLEKRHEGGRGRGREPKRERGSKEGREGGRKGGRREDGTQRSKYS